MAAVGLPRWSGGDDARVALRDVERWVTSPSMAALVGEFGGNLAGLSPEVAFAYLDEFSARHWDFRGGRERNLADSIHFASDREGIILRRARELGMERSAPRLGHYDTVLMTGGMVRAGITKPRYVRMLVDAGLSVGSVVFLGGFRTFAGDEHELAARLGVAGDDEFDSMVAGLDRSFGPLKEPAVREVVADTAHGSWRECSWQASGVRLSAVAAPSSSPERRANTADTFRFWAAQLRAPAEQSVLVVTAPVYVPYQGAVAVEVLGAEFGLSVETVGISAEAGDLGEHTQEFGARHHLQELRAAIRGMRSLHSRLSAPKT